MIRTFGVMAIGGSHNMPYSDYTVGLQKNRERYRATHPLKRVRKGPGTPYGRTGDFTKHVIEKCKLFCGCDKCGYKRCSGALEFHHRNPSKKQFNVTYNLNMALSDILIEALKC